jgi:hypothetical protein
VGHVIFLFHVCSHSAAVKFEWFIHQSHIFFCCIPLRSLVDHLNRIFTLRRKTALENTGITHIVSVLKYDFKDFEDWEKYEHLNIEVDDVEDENLLGEFERTGKWIEEGLKDGKDEKRGGVLVHW